MMSSSSSSVTHIQQAHFSHLSHEPAILVIRLGLCCRSILLQSRQYRLFRVVFSLNLRLFLVGPAF